MYKSCFRSSKQTFFKEATDSKTADPSKMWSTVKLKINPNSNTSITSIFVAGKTVDSLKEILDYFAKSFVVMLTGFALISISSCIKYFQSNITNHSPTHRSKLELKMFNQDDVKKGLSQIDSKSSPGYCGIPASIFSATANELSLPITSLFNLCLDSGKIPSDWKIALVRPNYKGKGSKQDPDNYRPISILSPISKLFESLIATAMCEFCETTRFLVTLNLGFVESCLVS